MRLPRMTTRRWMIAVAVVGALLACFATLSRLSALSGGYAAIAHEHARREREAARNRAAIVAGLARRVQEAELSAAAAKDPYVRSLSGEAVDRVAERARELVLAWRESERELAARAQYHAALRAKYRYAARRPWLPVPPDPPALE